MLDFGLAKAMEAGADSDQEISQGRAGLSLSPTLTAQMTQDGVILGTAAYMSPEQARGKPVDRRTDNWAFGVLLWEMLTGERCFAGETVTDLLSSITRDDPDLDRLPADTPPRVKELIARCTRKETSKRLQHIGDGRVLLEEVLAGDTGLDVQELPGTPETSPVQRLTVSINPPDGVRLVPGGDAILFASLDGDIMRAEVRTAEGRFEVLGIRSLFPTDLAQLPGDRMEIAPDGRVLISVPLDTDIDQSITLETGWAEQLTQ